MIELHLTYKQKYIFQNQTTAKIISPIFFEDLEVSMVETNSQRQAMIFSHATENNQQGTLIWASSVTKSVQSIDVFKIGNEFQAVISMINTLKPADNTATMLIIPIKKDTTSYSIPASLESIELERYIACSDGLKTSRRLIVVSCSERGYIQVWDIASKEMIIEDMMAAQRVPYEDI